jgi:hypothetical protein
MTAKNANVLFLVIGKAIATKPQSSDEPLIPTNKWVSGAHRHRRRGSVVRIDPPPTLERKAAATDTSCEAVT